MPLLHLKRTCVCGVIVGDGQSVHHGPIGVLVHGDGGAGWCDEGWGVVYVHDGSGDGDNSGQGGPNGAVIAVHI